MLAMLTLITLVGFLGSHFFTRRLVQAFGRLLERVPVVKMLYGALKDLLSAFVGPERRFDRPVTVTLSPGGGLRALGFITRDSLAHLGLAERRGGVFPAVLQLRRSGAGGTPDGDHPSGCARRPMS